jgi:hypothetical protein
MLSSSNEDIKSVRRFTAMLLLYEFLFIFFLAPVVEGIYAQSVYKDYTQQGQSQMGEYFKRGGQIGQEASWQSFVDTGAAVMQAQWEREAQLQLQNELNTINTSNLTAADKQLQGQAAQTNFDTAKLQWKNAVLDAIIQERGKWKAITGSVKVPDATPADFQQAITAARTAVLSSPALDLATWDLAIQCGVDLDCTANAQRAMDLVQETFTTSLNAELLRVKSANSTLSGVELTAFNAELSSIEGDLRKEFDIRTHFYTLRARNQYIAEMRVDVASAKLASSQQSATFITNQIIGQTTTQVNQMTSTSLAQAGEYIATITTADFNNLGTNWQERIQSIITSGLNAWDKAEEDLLAKRVEWANRQKTTLADGALVWQKEYDRILREKDKWLVDVQVAIKAGRAQWDAKFTQFASQRTQAEAQLQTFITAENGKWSEYNGKLSNMAMAGGSAILQAKNAVEYYNDLIGSVSPTATTCVREPDAKVCAFYIAERNYFTGATARFEGILNSVRLEMRSSMRGSAVAGAYSPDYLVDRRIYAGTLPSDVAAAGPGGFKVWLTNRLNTFTEDMVLYDRDLRYEISRADKNSTQAQGLTTQWSSLLTGLPGAFTRAAFQTQVDSLSLAWQDHKDALNAIIASSTSDTALLASVNQYLADNSNSDNLLFANVTKY